MSQTGSGSPWVTTTDGTNNAIVWVVGAQGDQRLHGYNGDTGAVVYAGGGANELMTGTANGTLALLLAEASTSRMTIRYMRSAFPEGHYAYTYSYSTTATPRQQRLPRQLRRRS